jgi:hypothetical protein
MLAKGKGQTRFISRTDPFALAVKMATLQGRPARSLALALP